MTSNSKTVQKQPQNIFTVTEKGDRKIMEAHQHAIIFVGLTRVGKSTVFNWVLKKPMIGKGNLNSHFIPQVASDNDVAVVGNSFASVTLAPNIYKDYEHQLSLVDMAGYEDTRDYVGVIGVSYFLKALFEKVRRVKFVIVFDENKFSEQACSGLIKTFQGFINMFNFLIMTPEIKKKILKSMSIIVTRAKHPENHYEYITEILQKMEDETFLFENKPLIIEILKQMQLSNKIDSFKAAKDKTPPEQCTFIPKFNVRGWQFFDLDQNEHQIGSPLITLPFTKDYQKLPPSQKDTFNTKLKQKIDQYLKYSEILKTLVNNFVENWNEFLQTWNREKVFNFHNFRLGKLFQEVKEFVRINDVYGSAQFIHVQLKVNYEAPSFIKSIKSILKLEEIVSTASTITDFQEIQKQVTDLETGEKRMQRQLVNLTFKDTMDKFKGYFAEMIRIIKIFATSQEEEVLLERANFILQRGFREFQKLYDLDSQMIHDIKIKLTGNCNSVFQLDSIGFRQLFINSLNESLLLKLFPSLQSLTEYESFFQEFSKQKQEASQKGTQDEADKVNIALSQRQCTIEMVKADLLCGLLEKQKALRCFILAVKKIIQITARVSGSSLYSEQEKTEELNKLSMKKLKLIKKIASVLKTVSDSNSNSFIVYALQLSKHHYMIEETCQIYQLLIDSVPNNDKVKLYDQYSEYCSKWGRFEVARILLQKKLSLEEDTFEEYVATANQLRKLQTEKEQNLTKYSQNLRNLGRLKQQDSELDLIIQQIQGDVNRLIEIVDQKKQLAKSD